MDVDLGLADLNIPVQHGNGTSLKQLVVRALALGYQTVALNTVVYQVPTHLPTTKLPMLNDLYVHIHMREKFKFCSGIYYCS